MPVANYLLDGDTLLVDFIGKFEHINEDWNFICKRLGLSFVLPHKKKTKREDYRSYYTAETRKIIELEYAADFAMFDYSFKY